jgi:hypothetical protein
MRRYRKGIGFVANEARCFTNIDRNLKVRLLQKVEYLERKTKFLGRRNGVVTQPGLIVYKALLLKFHNLKDGRCCPTYSTLQKVTGLCRQSIARAIAILESLGLLIVTRRLVRVTDAFGNIAVRQGSNLYGFSEAVPKGSVTAGESLPKAFPHPRVHGIGGNYKTESFNKRELPFWLNQVGFQGEQDAKFGSGHEHWRERARAALKSLEPAT